jgi:hypothetical protein
MRLHEAPLLMALRTSGLNLWSQLIRYFLCLNRARHNRAVMVVMVMMMVAGEGAAQQRGATSPPVNHAYRCLRLALVRILPELGLWGVANGLFKCHWVHWRKWFLNVF